MSERRLNVRCCCQPQKVYGSLPAPKNVRSGEHVKYAAGHEVLDLEVAEMYFRQEYTDEFLQHARPEVLALMRDSGRELAFKYDGDAESFEQKLARLRRVREFQEATQ